MLAAIKHGLANLLTVTGRDARQAFWFYVLFLVIIQFCIGLAASLPMTMESVTAGMQAGMAHAEDPIAAKRALLEATLVSMDHHLPTLLWTGIATSTLMIAGLAASFVRRLHDSGFPGFWAAVPAALEIWKIVDTPAQLVKAREIVVAQINNPAGVAAVYRSMGQASFAGWVAIGMVIVLGARKSTEGPNRYGDAPFVA